MAADAIEQVLPDVLNLRHSWIPHFYPKRKGSMELFNVCVYKKRFGQSGKLQCTSLKLQEFLPAGSRERRQLDQQEAERKLGQRYFLSSANSKMADVALWIQQLNVKAKGRKQKAADLCFHTEKKSELRNTHKAGKLIHSALEKYRLNLLADVTVRNCLGAKHGIVAIVTGLIEAKVVACGKKGIQASVQVNDAKQIGTAAEDIDLIVYDGTGIIASEMLYFDICEGGARAISKDYRSTWNTVRRALGRFLRRRKCGDA